LLADACVANGVRRFMYMSTDSTCGFTKKDRVFTASEPANPYKNYGKSKYAGEEYITQLTAQGKLEATSFRGFWFFGPNIPERNLAFFRSFSWPFQPVFGNGKNLRSISHCDDITDAFCRAEKAPLTIGKWYWLPTFVQAQTVDEIYRMVAAGLDKQANLFHIPNVVCDLMAIADTFLTERMSVLNPTIHAAGKFHKTIATDAAGIETSKQDFGWQPKVTAAQIQREIVDSLAKN
jgi:nucleoside-diphosphate-sugar epimerase